VSSLGETELAATPTETERVRHDECAASPSKWQPHTGDDTVRATGPSEPLSPGETGLATVDNTVNTQSSLGETRKSQHSTKDS
jgi:hypothetical protein